MLYDKLSLQTLGTLWVRTGNVRSSFIDIGSNDLVGTASAHFTATTVESGALHGIVADAAFRQT